MSELTEALAATKFGYDVRDRSMLDDDMIEHVETISTHHDELLLALVKASIFDEIVAQVKLGQPVEINQAFIDLLPAKIGFELGLIVKPELEAEVSSGPKI